MKGTLWTLGLALLAAAPATARQTLREELERYIPLEEFDLPEGLAPGPAIGEPPALSPRATPMEEFEPEEVRAGRGGPPPGREWQVVPLYVKDHLERLLYSSSSKPEFKAKADRYFKEMENNPFKPVIRRFEKFTDLLYGRYPSYGEFKEKMEGLLGDVMRMTVAFGEQERFLAEFDKLLSDLEKI
ncbi:MAG: hypothetical protein HY551_01340 [Elusimicrobia bacterium]|nr:hypothetical protein [Elusimicrobiota bacterium]